MRVSLTGDQLLPTRMAIWQNAGVESMAKN